MFRLLIVDDDAYILESLVRLFEQTEEPRLELYSARSAIDALRVMETVRIDIMLTDIDMPGMTGLQLFHQVRSLWPHCRVVFLSAFEEFEYVQEAIRNGSMDYLLKTEENEVIVASVRRAASSLSDAWQKETVLQDARAQMDEALPLLQQDYLRRLLNGQQAASDARRRKFAELKLPFDPGRDVVLVVGRVDDWGKCGAWEDRDLILFAMQNIAHEYLKMLDMRSVWQGDTKFIWMLQSGGLSMQGSDLAGYVQNNLDAIQRTYSGLLQLPVSFISVREPVGWHELQQKVDRLNRELFRGLGMRQEAILIEPARADAPYRDDAPAAADLDRKMLLLQNALQALQRQPFDALFEELAATACSLNVMRFLDIRSRIFVLLTTAWCDAESQILPDAEARWEALCSPDRFASRMESMLVLQQQFHRWFQLKRNEQTDPAQELIAKLHRYIVDHLDQELTLTSLSGVVYLNPDYLSRLYKQMTGENLHDFISRLKIAEGKRLLAETDFKVHEIAERVGILSREYFSRFFRKHTGMSPQEFRDNRR